ncbi:DUF89 domain-containing protein [Sphaerosporella brunnea]|uniref:Sugar phosphate phosphatase n=1 Tax=Sphaerosporella brunnea TaxID=1250544 RepID=A0A5J5EQX4_9PEZI|nr:DUF89 domain-containing protein [Sphaerosporella brunnea]
MEFDTKTPPYKTSDKTSFAYVSARDRWPVILTQAIDDIFRTTRDATDPQKIAEGKGLVEKLAKLKYEIQHDRVLTPLEDDGASDVAAYNNELQQLGVPRWFDVPWLYSECYLYRRLHSFLTQTTHWKNYDPFHAQKNGTFRASLAAVVELASKYRQIVTAAHTGGEEEKEKEELIFTEMMEICLWGNATDLSLLTSLTYEDIQKLQGSEARKASEANILINDLAQVFTVLRAAKDAGKESRRLDIVLDNAGFELFVDLVLAGYLLSEGLSTEVVLHPKLMPWFVSDVLPQDFSDLLAALQDPVKYFTTNIPEDAKAPELTEEQIADLKFLHQNWTGFVEAGKIRLREDRFWTLQGSYWRLPALAPELYEELKTSEIVVFKGDLNYRKLTGDAEWDPTTPFEEAIGPLGKKDSGVRTLALRTCKADVVVGLPQGKDEELKAGDVARKWGWSGKWAVVQFWDGKA